MDPKSVPRNRFIQLKPDIGAAETQPETLHAIDLWLHHHDHHRRKD